jgi:hypothetical protein
MDWGEPSQPSPHETRTYRHTLRRIPLEHTVDYLRHSTRGEVLRERLVIHLTADYALFKAGACVIVCAVWVRQAKKPGEKDTEGPDVVRTGFVGLILCSVSRVS